MLLCRSPAPRAIWFQHRCKTTNLSFAQGSAPANPPACQLSDGGATIPPPATLFGHRTRPIPAAPLTLIARRAGLLQRATPTSAAALSKPGPPGDLVPTPLQNHQPLVRAGISPCQPAGLSIERWWCHHSPSRNPFRSPDPPDPCSTPHLDRPEGRAPKIPPDLGSGAVGARPPGRSGFAADPKPPNLPSCTGHSPSNQTASQWG